MTLAIEGPTVSIVEPCGRFWSIQTPASRPAGSPPVPARNARLVDGWIESQVGKIRLSTITAHAPFWAAVRHRGMRRVSWDQIVFDVSARVANNATGGARGSR